MPKPGQQAPRKWVVNEDGDDVGGLKPLPPASGRRARQRRAIFASAAVLLVSGAVAAYVVWGGGGDALGLGDRTSDPTAQLDPRSLGDVYQLVDYAESLSEAGAKALETRLKASPEDLKARTILVAFYSNLDNRSPEAGKAHGAHVRWLIDNEPKAPVLGTLTSQMRFPDATYEGARKALVAQLQKSDKDLVLLRNAGIFLSLHDPERAEKILARGQALDPNNPEWSQWRGELSLDPSGAAKQRPKPAASDKVLAAEAAELEKALSALDGGTVEVPPGNPPFAQLGDLAITALRQGKPDRARVYALSALRKAKENRQSWAYGEVVHWANIVIGHLALQVKRTDLAEKYLLRAGNVPTSPRLNARGPDLSLVKALLAEGSRKAALEYVEASKVMWPKGKEKGTLARWIRQLKSGQDADFKTP